MNRLFLRRCSSGLAVSVLAGLVVVQVGVAAALLAPPALATSPTAVTFSTPGTANWTVPVGVTSIQVDARGAQGQGGAGGQGGRVVATVPVTPGENLVVAVGGSDGTNGGGQWNPNYPGYGNQPGFSGGGASDLREGGSALSNRIVVAGGGGGQGAFGGAVAGMGGAGGSIVGQSGQSGFNTTGGAGGSQAAGGAGGADNGTSGIGGSPGSLGQGGVGGDYDEWGGGGGGGYYGGGGGATDSIAMAAGGGGGSSYLEASATNVSSSQGFSSGNGEVIITYPPGPVTSPAPVPGSVSFTSPGMTDWVVPAGVSSIEVDVQGSQGGGTGGLGGRVVATIPVTPGEGLAVSIGGSDGTGGGGSASGGYAGGGASDLREAGPQLANRILVAAGGGAQGTNSGGVGGGGGGSTGANGAPGVAATGGSGATQSAGGAGGTLVQPDCSNVLFGNGAGVNGGSGSLGVGGIGAAYDQTGGGGGGGYYGGGGGATCSIYSAAGGGGGSSYAEATATVRSNVTGYRSGTGQILIAWPTFQAVGGPLAAYEEMAHNPSEKACTACAGDPIDTATGNFFEDVNDLSVPGRGVPLAFTRSYNSLMAPTNGPLGYGWTDSYNMSLSLGSGSPPVTATVNQENGTQVSFSVSGTAYTAPPRVLATLVQNPDGTFTFTRQATQIFTFNAAGQLSSEKDLNGHTTSLAFNGSGQLTAVTDPAGRTLTLSWSNGHIASVVDTASPPRTVSFGYNDGAGNLTDVIDAAGGHTVYNYDTSHRLLTMRAPKYYGDTTTTPTPVTTNHYNAAGQVDWQTDPLGHQTSFSYTEFTTTITDAKGNMEVQQYRDGVLVSDTKGAGTPQAATWVYTYDPATLGMTTVVDPDDNTTTSTYDASGNLLSTTDALNRTTTTTYNAFNEPLTVVDPKGVTTTMVYDAAGNLLARSTPLLDGSGHILATQQTTYTYGDPSHPGDITAVTDPNNKVSNFAYNADGDLTSVTDPLGNKTTYGYDGVGRRTSMVSPNGNIVGGNPAAHTTTYAVDAFGRVTATVDQLNHTQARSVYDPNGNLVTATDADNNTTSYSYNADNQLMSTTRADHSTLASGYDMLGNLVTQTDAAGNSTIYAYSDPALETKATSVTDPLQRTTAYTYDRGGNLLTKQDPGGNCSATPKTGCTTYGYDAANEQTSITYSDGVTPNVTNTVYDPDGQRTSTTDGTGTSSWSYDSLHRLTSSTNGAGSAVGYGYDLKGNVTTLTYPGSTGTVVRGYDDAGRLHTVRDWNNNTTTFNYDADSNLVSTAYPNGTTATNTVDAADRAMGISASKNATPSSPFLSFSYSRDAANQETAVTSTGVPADNNSYSYNQLNELTGVNAASYGYSAADNLTGLTSGASQVFDAANEVTATVSGISRVGTASASDTGKVTSLSVTFPTTTTVNDQILLSATVPYSVSVSTPSGYSLVTTTSSGTANSSAKVVLFRKTAATGDTGVTVVFGTKNAAKAVAAIVYRNVNPSSPIDVSSSGFMAGGTSVTAPAVTTTAASDQLVMIEGANNSSSAGTWTAPSSMTSRLSQAAGTSLAAAIADKALAPAGTTGSQTATFSVSAQLVGILVALKPVQTTYAYDLRGNRIAINPAGASTVTLTYDQANRLTAYGTTSTYAYNGDSLRMSKTLSGATSRFTWDLAEGLPLLLVDGATDYLYGPGGLPLEQVGTSGTLYYYQDQLGSTRALATAAGTVTATYTYDAYGRLTGSTGTASNPFGYAGQYTDAESGLIYLRARYYDPATGQFMSRDPLESATSIPYAYGSDNPSNRVDPSGLADHYANFSLNAFELEHWSCDDLLAYMILLMKELRSRDADFRRNKNGYGYEDRGYSNHVDVYRRVESLLALVHEVYTEKCNALSLEQTVFILNAITKNPDPLGHPGVRASTTPKRSGLSLLGHLIVHILSSPFVRVE